MKIAVIGVGSAQFGVGMQRSIRLDFEISASYGVRQTVADTLGIGAIVRILRTAHEAAGTLPEALHR